MRFSFIVAAAAAAIASPALADQACIDAWTKDIQPIVNQYCVACHQNASPAGKLTLQKGKPPADLINVKSDESPLPFVTPGDPAKSYLMHKLKGTQNDVGGSGGQMPLGGKLPDPQIAAIEAWITGCTGS